jgi:hypothetical protein
MRRRDFIPIAAGAAKSLDLTIPLHLLGLAEVIE